MSEAKFTKGPWVNDGPKICGNGTFQDTDGCVVATVTTLYDAGRWFQDIPNRNSTTFHANALLIAAAPELYEALRALCAWHDHPSLTGNKHGAPVADWAPSFDETVTMVHAALAKARGEQP